MSETKYASIESLSFLLKLYNVDMSESEALKILRDKNIVLQLYRPNMVKGGDVKSFDVLSAKGLKYGTNDRNSSNPLETKIYWYLSEFQQVVEILEDKE